MYADDPHLGSLDAIHVVCAPELGEDLEAFITCDKALARAAQRHELTFERPQ